MRRSIAALEVDAREEHKETSDTHFENGSAVPRSKTLDERSDCDD